MFSNLGLIMGIIHDAVELVEKTCNSQNSDEKKQAAKDFVKKELNKVPALQATIIDDVVVDAGIEASVGFMNKFKKDKA